MKIWGNLLVTLISVGCATAPKVNVPINASPLRPSPTAAPIKTDPTSNLKLKCEDDASFCNSIDISTIELQSESDSFLKRMCEIKHAKSCLELGNRYYNNGYFVNSMAYYKDGCRLKNQASCDGIKDVKIKQTSSSCEDGNANDCRSAAQLTKDSDEIKRFNEKAKELELDKQKENCLEGKISECSKAFAALGNHSDDAFEFFKSACNNSKPVCSAFKTKFKSKIMAEAIALRDQADQNELERGGFIQPGACIESGRLPFTIIQRFDDQHYEMRGDAPYKSHLLLVTKKAIYDRVGHPVAISLKHTGSKDMQLQNGFTMRYEVWTECDYDQKSVCTLPWVSPEFVLPRRPMDCSKN